MNINVDYIISWALANKRNTALFTKFGKREVSKLSYQEIEEVFGREEAEFVRMSRSGQILVNE